MLRSVLVLMSCAFLWVAAPRVLAGPDQARMRFQAMDQNADGEITRASGALRKMFKPHKMNVASLGNAVPQLHIHIIARQTGDAAWPKPVWGVVPAKPYAADAIAAFQKRFTEAVGR